MKNYTKNIVKSASKAFALFLIVSILVPAPMFSAVYTVYAEEVAPAAEAAPVSADVAPTTGVATPAPTADVVNADAGGPVPQITPAAGTTPVNPVICIDLDMNNDGKVDRDDFTAYETAYNNGDIRADFDHNGFLNANDFQAFMDAYTQCSNSHALTCPYLDINNDGIVNGADFTAFEVAYNNGDMRADFDFNGLLNPNDFQMFMNAYAGCVTSPAPTCPLLDINSDSIVNADDFTAFEVAYSNGDMKADFDHNGLLNPNDFQAYMDAYANCVSGGNTNPTMGVISLTPGASGETTEDGGIFQFTVTLLTTPTAPVMIDIMSSNTAEGTLSTSTITLDAAHMSETVTVTGVDDSIDDGDIVYTVVTSPSVSADSHYNNINIPDLSVKNIDNDTTNGGGNGGGGSTGGGGGSGFTSSGGGYGVGGVGEVLGAATVNPNLCNYLGVYLKKGANNDPLEVMKLQAFLKTLEGSSDVQVNGIFDDATFNAVSNFQKKYSGDILAPWGYDNDNSTGYVYILTKKKVNEIVCKSPVSLTSAQQSEIDSFRAAMKSLALGSGEVKKKLVRL